MGTSRSASQLTEKLGRAARELATNQPAIAKVGLATKTVFIAEAARVGVGRGIGRTRISKGVSARFDTKGGLDATALVRYTGPAHLLNNPTQPHSIFPRARGGKQAIVIADGAVRASARHPGTRGLKFFEKARDKARVVVPPLVRREMLREPLRRVFK